MLVFIVKMATRKQLLFNGIDNKKGQKDMFDLLPFYIMF